MKHYLAKLVFQIVNNSNINQFDEQLRLIEADSYPEAVEKATLIGESEDDVFLSSDNNKVRWKFIALSDLYYLENLEHGLEIHSSIIEQDRADNYIKVLRLKHKELTGNLVSAI